MFQNAVGQPPRRRRAVPPPGWCVLATAAFGLSMPAVAADRIVLDSGAVVSGTILKRDDQRVWVDVGPDVLMFRIDDIRDIDAEGADAAVELRPETLFYTARNLPELSPQEQAKRIGPAVIKVATPNGLGSGVILNEDGYAITNAHVVQGETSVRAIVWLPDADGSTRRTTIEDVEIIAVNNHLDLALLRLQHPQKASFLSAPLEASERIEVGQVVFAIGNPLGLERTLSQGVISTTSRSFDGLAYVQTDAAINPGNSGGPLFNTKGEVIGITNMGIRGGEALGFAIPTRYVKDFIRHRVAFAYDKSNPNSGHRYLQPPPRTRTGVAPPLLDGDGRNPPV
ncbi:MAG: trypsin-like serine protease [Phycisphaerales bacterium]|nr:trypsin-like peptidase domain-containing protein [Phycisphaerae bacterium]NNF43989.1 trypsin-like serine protease [Phycisphaerales bacterium]NNM27793.1 trypsin-like serine protease [Phycisphaerales bacterium]